MVESVDTRDLKSLGFSTVRVRISSHAPFIIMNCDECKHYCWYYDHCEKWDCEVDAREVHNCFEHRATPIRDAMVNPVMSKSRPYLQKKEKGAVLSRPPSVDKSTLFLHFSLVALSIIA